MSERVYIYTWGNNRRRSDLKGKHCRVIARGTSMKSCLLEFEDGERVISSARAIRLLTQRERDQLTL